MCIRDRPCADSRLSVSACPSAAVPPAPDDADTADEHQEDPQAREEARARRGPVDREPRGDLRDGQRPVSYTHLDVYKRQGDLGGGGERPPERRRVEVGREAVDLGDQLDRTGNQVLRDGGLQQPWRPRVPGGAADHLVQPEVVTVPLAAVGVVADHAVGLFLSLIHI